jgi:hypothetical protein
VGQLCQDAKAWENGGMEDYPFGGPPAYMPPPVQSKCPSGWRASGRARAAYVLEVYRHEHIILAWVFAVFTGLKLIYFFMDHILVNLAVCLKKPLDGILGDWKIFTIGLLLIALVAFWESSYRLHRRGPKIQGESLSRKDKLILNQAEEEFAALTWGLETALCLVDKFPNMQPSDLSIRLVNYGFSGPDANIVGPLIKTTLVSVDHEGRIGLSVNSHVSRYVESKIKELKRI